MNEYALIPGICGAVGVVVAFASRQRVALDFALTALSGYAFIAVLAKVHGGGGIAWSIAAVVLSVMFATNANRFFDVTPSPWLPKLRAAWKYLVSEDPRWKTWRNQT